MRYIDRVKIYSSPNYIRFLRENSSYEKYFSRRGDFSLFDKDMKGEYSIRFRDKVSKFNSSVSLFKAFFDLTK